MGLAANDLFIMFITVNYRTLLLENTSAAFSGEADKKNPRETRCTLKVTRSGWCWNDRTHCLDSLKSKTHCDKSVKDI